MPRGRKPTSGATTRLALALLARVREQSTPEAPEVVVPASEVHFAVSLHMAGRLHIVSHNEGGSVTVTPKGRR